MLRWNIVTSPVDQVVIIAPGLLITLPCDGGYSLITCCMLYLSLLLFSSSHAVGFHLRCSQSCSALDVFGRAKLSGKVSLTDRLFVSISGFFLPRTCGFLCGLTVTLLKEIIYSGGYKKKGGGPLIRYEKIYLGRILQVFAGLGGGTSIDFTEILGTFGFFPENKFFVHPNYENCNIYPKNGDCDPKKQSSAL